MGIESMRMRQTPDLGGVKESFYNKPVPIETQPFEDTEPGGLLAEFHCSFGGTASKVNGRKTVALRIDPADNAQANVLGDKYSGMGLLCRVYRVDYVAEANAES